jgi:hypothetical protein
LLREDGDFLVRETEPEREGERSYVLTIRHANHGRHFIIQQKDNKVFVKAERKFSSIPELVNYYLVSRSALNGTKLLRPISSQKWELRKDQVTSVRVRQLCKVR